MLLVALLFLSISAKIEIFPEQPDIRLECRGESGRMIYLALHENEHVIERDLIRHPQRYPGRFLILRQNGERNLVLKFADRSLELDPNRMFSRKGIELELLESNPGLSIEEPHFEMAAARAERLAAWLIEQCGELTSEKVLIALHNNTNGYDNDGRGGIGTLSMRRYQEKQRQGAKFIKKLHMGGHDEDDLIYLTREEDFEALKKAGWNLVLQDPIVTTDREEDDGSLSMYAQKHNVRYFNIEAQRNPDHRRVQLKMLKAVKELVLKDEG